MFTIEHEEDFTIITILDDEDKCDELEVEIGTDVVNLRQWHVKSIEDHEIPEWEIYDQITITPRQFLKLMEAFNLKEGVYQLENPAI